MEQILKRNHPNSISALILTANSEGTEPSPRLKYLENRVQQLEQELSKSKTDAQVSVREIQDKFHSMKVKCCCQDSPHMLHAGLQSSQGDALVPGCHLSSSF
jgi:DNA-directed RNA polymerase alpha subunit